MAVEPELVNALMNDAPKEDALPLLAFALQRLWRQYAASSSLTLSQYANMGGLTGIIEDAAERALHGIEPGDDRPLEKSALPQSLNRLGNQTFVPALADVTEKGALIRRAARWKDFTPEQQELLERFDRWRLISRRGEAGGTVEVAHEALFNSWPRLKEWLEPERARLEALRGTKSAADAWFRHDKRPDYLAHGGERLKDALGLLDRPEYARELVGPDRDYLQARAKAERARHRHDLLFRWGLRASVAALAAAFVFAVYSFREAIHERDHAQTETERAEKALNAAVGTVNGLVFDVTRKFQAKAGIPRSLIDAILVRTKEFTDDLSKGGATTPALERSRMVVLLELADEYKVTDRLDKARQMVDESIEIMKRLIASDLDNTFWLRDLWVCYGKAGELGMAQNAFPDAGQAFEQALAIARHLTQVNSENVSFQFDLAKSYTDLVGVNLALGAKETAAKMLDKVGRLQSV